ncbi:MAG: carboxypeptidase-like regulatory domain-containing protein [Proteobacteria bacterium]|nr:carboxypeptidase-like regulatory domain-containing protein [Pseudomonadota bacterium]
MSSQKLIHFKRSESLISFKWVLVPIGAMLLGFMSCMPQKRSAISSEVSGADLTLSGIVTLPSGLAIEGVDIFFDIQPNSVVKSGPDGKFILTLTESTLQKNAVLLKGGRTSWNIYAKKPGTIELAGISIPISSSQRGPFDLNSIVLNPVASVSGQVVKASSNLLSPIIGASVTIGSTQVTTDSTGRFKASKLPSGPIPITVEAPKLNPHVSYIDIVAGSDIDSNYPIVMFADAGPNAVVLVNESVTNTPRSTSATTKLFTVIPSPTAKYIRYHHTADELAKPVKSTVSSIQNQGNGNGNNGNNGDNGRNQNGFSLANWKPITDEISYSFLGEGPATLWYQVADESLAKVSDILQVNLNIDSCKDLDGIIIGDGSGIIASRTTSISFSGLPANATRVRLSDNINNINSSPWMALNSQMPFSFGQLSQNSNGETVSSSQRTVYAQIATTTGECPVVTSHVAIQAFPQSSDMFAINAGAPVSLSKLVQIDIPNLPPNAFEMKVWENGTNISSTFWQRASSSAPFLLSSTGTKIVNLQFRDLDGLSSPVYTEVIDIRQSETAGVTLSFASLDPNNQVGPVIPSRYILMQFIPPQNALAFRFMELITDGGNSNLGGNGTASGTGASTDPNDISNYPWINLVPFYVAYARGIGLRSYTVEYLTNDGIKISTTSQIFIPEIPANIGDFTINNGSPTSLFPTVELQVTPPINAVAMSATNLTLQQTTANSSTNFSFGQSSTSSVNDQWVSPIQNMSFRLDSRGTQSIQIRFRDPNGNVNAPSVVKSIIFEPFPPFPDNVKVVDINNSATTTNNLLVNIKVTLPESAHSYRISQDREFNDSSEFLEIPTSTKTTIAGVTWKVFEFTVPYLMTGGAGPKILYLQAANELGERSWIYTSIINYQP